MTVCYDQPHTVYIHRNASGGVLYVGCTVDLKKRTAAHRRSRWFGDVATVEVDSLHDDWDSAYAREHALIGEHEPPYNIQGNPAVDREKWAYQLMATMYGIRAAGALEHAAGSSVEALRRSCAAIDADYLARSQRVAS